jgi:uncharacterized protein (DUF2147 family)
MRFRKPRLIVAAALAASIGAAGVASAAEPTGFWLLQGSGAVVEITSCGTGLCARITALLQSDAERGPVHLDRSLCGWPVMEGFQPAGAAVWEGDALYNPLDGRVYRGRITLESAQRLHVRAFLSVPLFGETYYLTKVDRLSSLGRDDLCAGRAERGMAARGAVASASDGITRK